MKEREGTAKTGVLRCFYCQLLKQDWKRKYLRGVIGLESARANKYSDVKEAFEKQSRIVVKQYGKERERSILKRKPFYCQAAADIPPTARGRRRHGLNSPCWGRAESIPYFLNSQYIISQIVNIIFLK